MNPHLFSLFVTVHNVIALIEYHQSPVNRTTPLSSRPNGRELIVPISLSGQATYPGLILNRLRWLFRQDLSHSVLRNKMSTWPWNCGAQGGAVSPPLPYLSYYGRPKPRINTRPKSRIKLAAGPKVLAASWWGHSPTLREPLMEWY